MNTALRSDSADSSLTRLTNLPGMLVDVASRVFKVGVYVQGGSGVWARLVGVEQVSVSVTVLVFVILHKCQNGAGSCSPAADSPSPRGPGPGDGPRAHHGGFWFRQPQLVRHGVQFAYSAWR